MDEVTTIGGYCTQVVNYSLLLPQNQSLLMIDIYNIESAKY